LIGEVGVLAAADMQGDAELVCQSANAIKPGTANVDGEGLLLRDSRGGYHGIETICGVRDQFLAKVASELPVEGPVEGGGV